MITKQQFTDSCLKEIRIFKHLYGKVLPGSLDYRPSEKQRSLKQLLQFIMHSFVVELYGIETGSIGDLGNALKEAASTDTKDFPAKMDELGEKIKSLMQNMTEEKLNEEIDLFNRSIKQTRSAWLLELILKNMVGYKMQLFLYIKQSGNHEIGTADVWRGEDTKK